MANTSGLNSQSVPRKDEVQSAECPPDNKLPENSQENLDARLDHAIEETFPTSDPISVTITKGPEPDRPDQEASTGGPGRQRKLTSKFWIRSEKPCTTLPSKRLDAAREVYSRGERYVRQAGEQYPEAERYIRAGERAVTHRVTENPLPALFMAGVAGYALAWLIHGKKRDREPDVPDHARTSRGYTAHHGL